MQKYYLYKDIEVEIETSTGEDFIEIQRVYLARVNDLKIQPQKVTRVLSRRTIAVFDEADAKRISHPFGFTAVKTPPGFFSV